MCLEAHNPKVGGSNPPATKFHGPESHGSGPFSFVDHHSRKHATKRHFKTTSATACGHRCSPKREVEEGSVGSSPDGTTLGWRRPLHRAHESRARRVEKGSVHCDWIYAKRTIGPCLRTISTMKDAWSVLRSRKWPSVRRFSGSLCRTRRWLVEPVAAGV